MRSRMAPDGSKSAGPHQCNPDADRDEQQLNRDRRGEGIDRHDGGQLLAHQERDRQRQAGNADAGKRTGQCNGRLIAVAPGAVLEETSPCQIDRADQQQDAEGHFNNLDGNRRDGEVRKNDRFHQDCSGTAHRAWVDADKLSEIGHVMRVGELVQSREEELKSKGSLNQRRSKSRESVHIHAIAYATRYRALNDEDFDLSLSDPDLKLRKRGWRSG